MKNLTEIGNNIRAMWEHDILDNSQGEIDIDKIIDAYRQQIEKLVESCPSNADFIEDIQIKDWKERVLK